MNASNTERAREASRANDEIAALVDLQGRLRRLRRQVLPLILAGVALGVVGASAHVSGYWSVFGTVRDPQGGDFYYISSTSGLLAFGLAAAPLFGVAVALYVFCRARLRARWRSEYERHGLDGEFLEHNSQRYG